MNTHDKYELPPPHGYIYVWDGPYGTHRLTGGQYNGRQCDRTVAYYTEDQVHAAIEAVRAALDEQSTAITGWHGWACQYPGRFPRFYGTKAIAELNHDPDNGDRLFLVAEVQEDAQPATSAPAPKGEPVAWTTPDVLEQMRSGTSAWGGMQNYYGRGYTAPLYAAPVNERDAKDAQRYRWLRHMIFDERIIVAPDRMLHGDGLDSAVDAAIAQQGKESQ